MGGALRFLVLASLLKYVLPVILPFTFRAAVFLLFLSSPPLLHSSCSASSLFPRGALQGCPMCAQRMPWPDCRHDGARGFASGHRRRHQTGDGIPCAVVCLFGHPCLSDLRRAPESSKSRFLSRDSVIMSWSLRWRLLFFLLIFRQPFLQFDSS